METEDEDIGILAAHHRLSIIFLLINLTIITIVISLMNDDTDAKKVNFPMSTCLVNNRAVIQTRNLFLETMPLNVIIFTNTK